MIKDNHEARAHGHQGVDRTMHRISRHYYFEKMKQTVKAVIGNCATCSKGRIKRHKPYGLLQPNEAPQRPWEQVSMDFITKLPKSTEPGTKRKCDTILVIVDRLTKHAYFKPITEKTNAAELAYEVIRTLVSEHGMPLYFITD